MAKVIKTTFKIRRGESEVWENNNPLLVEGEPGYELDEHKLKVGDNSNRWKDLPYIGEHNIVNCSVRAEFPKVGNEKYIYKASHEKLLYQWDAEIGDYVALGAVSMDEEDSDDALEMLVEMGIIAPVTDEMGVVFTNENGAIITI